MATFYLSSGVDITINMNKAIPSIILDSTADLIDGNLTIETGIMYTLMANVYGVYDENISGNVSFFKNNSLIGTVNLNNYYANLNILTYNLGTFTFNAKYNGNINYDIANSNYLEISVIQGSIDNTVITNSFTNVNRFTTINSSYTTPHMLTVLNNIANQALQSGNPNALDDLLLARECIDFFYDRIT
jgi:hypothetical protein